MKWVIIVYSVGLYLINMRDNEILLRTLLKSKDEGELLGRLATIL
jgi:hypothetical protein